MSRAGPACSTILKGISPETLSVLSRRGGTYLPHLFLFRARPRHDECRLSLSRPDPARPSRRGPAVPDGLAAAARPVPAGAERRRLLPDIIHNRARRCCTTGGTPMSYVDGFIVAVPKKNLAAYRHGHEGRQGLARAWRAGLPRMGGRGRQGRKAHLVSAQRQAQAGRDGRVLLDHLQVARAARPRQRQGDGRQAAGRHDGHQIAAVRRQADDLWRVRKPREGVKRTYAAAAGPVCSPSMARSMASITAWVS